MPGFSFMAGLACIKKVGLFELKQGGIVLIELLEYLRHDNFSHELGFVRDFVLLTIEV